jgi:hypothetical protein
MTLVWVDELTRQFWGWAGGEPTGFPRDLRLPIARAFALTPVSLPDLCVESVDRWLDDCGIDCTLETQDRPLRACLVACAGGGAIFLDDRDPAAEQRFSLAHELAHFLHDYVEPRRQAIERLGPAIREVLDGERDPLPAERMQALLARAPLGFMVHLMVRGADGGTDARIAAVERDADRLALELLAPEALVRSRLEADGCADRSTAEGVIARDFALPAAQAARYAAELLPESRRPLSFLEHLQRAR